MTSPDNSEVLVAIARLDGKLDLALAENAALKAKDDDHESRIRAIEGLPTPDEDTDKRLKALEDRRTVSPGQLWSGLAGVAGLILTILTIVEKWPALTGG